MRYAAGTVDVDLLYPILVQCCTSLYELPLMPIGADAKRIVNKHQFEELSSTVHHWSGQCESSRLSRLDQLSRDIMHCSSVLNMCSEFADCSQGMLT